MNTVKRYAGGCHCGKVRFEAQLDLSQPVVTCNCSICSKTGTMLAFVPAEQVEVRSGEDGLTDYQFGKKQVHHLFCATCGVKPFGRGAAPDGRRMYAVNVRCLDEVDLDTLQVTRFDGRSL